MDKLTTNQFKKQFRKALKDKFIFDRQYPMLCDLLYKLPDADVESNIDYLHCVNTNQRKRMFYFCFNDYCDKKRGVYKITYQDEGFYIGRAKYLKTRFKVHERDIKKFYETNEYPDNHFLKNVFEYLKADELRIAFDVELLEECQTVDELFNGEQKWLTHYKNDPNCLNAGFIATKPWNEIDETPEEEKERKSKNRTYVKNGKRIWYKTK
jgi:hypothetical protein